MTLNQSDDDTLSSNESEDSSNEDAQEIRFDDEIENATDDEDNDEQPPIFDSSKESEYTIKYDLSFEEAINLDNVYILHLDAQKQGHLLKVAIALSDFSSKIYDLNSGNKDVQVLNEHDGRIVDIKFGKNNTDSSIVFTGSEDGTIKLWDLRTKEKCSTIYKDDTDQSLKPLSCFDVSSDGRFLVAGTEVLADDSFLLFWDLRMTKLLGGYWDTHQDDITQVKFHPSEEKTVISGSTDGIINMFDITQTTEKDALQLTYNTNSSVSMLNWLKDKNEDWVISCVTHTEDLQLWHTTDSIPFTTIPRITISKSMNIKPDAYSQVINCHQADKNGNAMLLVGNNHGKGEHLQSLNIEGGHIVTPRTLFKGNKQIIRCSWYDYDSETIITGGEAGILNVWTPKDDNNLRIVTDKSLLKHTPKVSLKNKTHKPY